MYGVTSTLLDTTSYCISCTFILLPFISFTALWPSPLQFLMLSPTTIIWLIFPLPFIFFNHLFILLDFSFPQNMVIPTFPTWIFVSLYEPVIWSANIMVGGDCFLGNLFYMHHHIGTCVGDTYNRIELVDTLLNQQ